MTVARRRRRSSRALSLNSSLAAPGLRLSQVPLLIARQPWSLRNRFLTARRKHHRVRLRRARNLRPEQLGQGHVRDRTRGRVPLPQNSVTLVSAQATRVRPGAVLGPVLARAFARLASFLRSLVNARFPSGA
jgi:hypothetical protein